MELQLIVSLTQLALQSATLVAIAGGSWYAVKEARRSREQAREVAAAEYLAKFQTHMDFAALLVVGVKPTDADQDRLFLSTMAAIESMEAMRQRGLATISEINRLYGRRLCEILGHPHLRSTLLAKVGSENFELSESLRSALVSERLRIAQTVPELCHAPLCSQLKLAKSA